MENPWLTFSETSQWMTKLLSHQHSEEKHVQSSAISYTHRVSLQARPGNRVTLGSLSRQDWWGGGIHIVKTKLVSK